MSDDVCMCAWVDGWLDERMMVDGWITVSGINTENQDSLPTSEARVETDRNLADSFTVFQDPVNHLR